LGWGSGIRQTFNPLLLFLLRFSSQSHLCQSRELIPPLWSLVATLQISRHDNVPLLPPALARGSPSSVVTEIVRAAPLTADYPTLSVTAAPMGYCSGIQRRLDRDSQLPHHRLLSFVRSDCFGDGFLCLQLDDDYHRTMEPLYS